jgi:hypothetical protein
MLTGCITICRHYLVMPTQKIIFWKPDLYVDALKMTCFQTSTNALSKVQLQVNIVP